MEGSWLAQELLVLLKDLEESPMTDDDLTKFEDGVVQLIDRAREEAEE